MSASSKSVSGRGGEGLARAERIRRSPEFREVMDRGGRGTGALLVAFLRAAETDSEPARRSRLGVVASRRVGPAVARNRAKRRLREIYRRSERPAGDLVLVARRGLAEAPWAEVAPSYRTAIRWALRRTRDSGDSSAGDSGSRARQGPAGS